MEGDTWSMKKIISAILLTAAAIVSLTACAAPFDAAGYTKACLDAIYHKEYDSYLEFVDTTIEEAKESLELPYQEAVYEKIDALEYNITQEEKEAYLALLLEMEQLVKYEVGEAYETDNGFEVSVVVYPINVYEEFLLGIDAQYQALADEGKLNDDTIFPTMLDYLNECIKNVQYEDPTTITIRVEKKDSEIWQINQEDLAAIDEVLL